MEYRNLKLDDIKVRQKWNIRDEVISETIHSLAESIKAIGVQNPIIVNESLELVAGYRRLCACRKLEMAEIPARIISYESNEHERLAHIDENLQTRSLSPKNLDRALSERKAIWVKLYPTPKKGRPREDCKTPKSFERETSDLTGQHEAEIRKRISRVDRASQKVRLAYEADLIKAGHIDELIRLPEKYQDVVLQKILAKFLSIAETRVLILDIIEKKKNDICRDAVRKFNAADAAKSGKSTDEQPITIPAAAEPPEEGFKQFGDVDIPKLERVVATKRIDNHVRSLNNLMVKYIKDHAWENIDTSIITDIDANLAVLEANILAIRAAISA
jgi:ParB family chromosome partitioning protein